MVQQILGYSMVTLGLFWGAVVFCYVVFKFFVSHFKKKHAASNCSWRGRIDYILTRPAELLLSAIFVCHSAIWILKKWEVDPNIFDLILVTKDLIAIFCISWTLFRWKKVVYQSLFNRRLQGKMALDSTSLEFLSKIFTLFVSLLATLSVFYILGMNILPLVTFGGIGAATVAFASKDVFANFFSGFMLHITRPFAVRDTIELPGKKVKGVVEEIGWCLTVIRDPQNGPVYLPNSLFSSEVLINNSRTKLRRIEETLCFCSESLNSLHDAIEEIQDALRQHPGVDPERPVLVFLKSLAAPFVELEIKAYTLSPFEEEFMRVKQEVLLTANRILEQKIFT